MLKATKAEIEEANEAGRFERQAQSHMLAAVWEKLLHDQKSTLNNLRGENNILDALELFAAVRFAMCDEPGEVDIETFKKYRDEIHCGEKYKDRLIETAEKKPKKINLHAKKFGSLASVIMDYTGGRLTDHLYDDDENDG